MSPDKMTRQPCTNNNKVTSLEKFMVRMSEPELVGPAKPTPRELKQLSDVDDQVSHRTTVPMIHFYRCNPSVQGKDPAKVIRDALANALVFYYPLAGRLIEGLDGKLSVDCTGEGVQFVEADADVELVNLGDPLFPPFPCFEQFLYDVPVSGGIVNSPLFFFQVTHLICGSFVLAYRMNHIMCDAPGLGQFLNALGEIARGAHAPSITPIWRRELFNAGQSSQPTNHRREEVKHPITLIFPFNNNDMIHRCFFFGPSELSALRKLMPDHLRSSRTMFEILTACLWRCRTIALGLDCEALVHFMCVVNARDKTNQVVPVGYYGNAAMASIIGTSAKKLCESPIEYVLELVRKVKEEGVKECMSWRVNGPVIVAHRPRENCFIVTDARGDGYAVDFGWGKAAYAGIPGTEFGPVSMYQSFRNHKQEDGILVHLCLETKAMRRFETELNNLLSRIETSIEGNESKSKILRSSL